VGQVALSTYGRRGTTPFGTRARVALGQGNVEGGLALVGIDRRAGTAIYALRIANQSAQPLRARMTCSRSREAPVLAYPLDVHVAPFAIAETILPVRLADVGPFDRAIVKVSGADIAFTLEAPAPARRNTRLRWLGVAAALAALIFGGAFGAATATPHLDLLGAPARAFAGSPLDVPYAFRGWGAMQYTLQTKDGRQLAAGLLTQRQGTLHFAVPRNAGAEIVLAAHLSGPLGTMQTSRRILLGSNPASLKRLRSDDPARIDELAVASPLIQAGSPLTVRYTTNASSGQLWAIDDAGRLWATAALSQDGSTVMNIPQAAAGRKMRVVLHARNGATNAVSSVGILVLPRTVTAEAADSGSAQAQTVGLDLSTAAAAPGDEVTVSIRGDHGDARISLNDAAGTTLETGDIPASQSAVTLTMPGVQTATTYYVVANLSAGVGEQSIVRKLVVAPR